MNEIILKNIELFKTKINRNATLINGFKYPYKSFLIISLFNNLFIEKLFNNNIYLEDHDDILKTYYNLIVSNLELFEILKAQKQKESWINVGYNELTKKNIINNIFENPARHLEIDNTNFWIFNKKGKFIRINIDLKIIELQELKKEILEYAFFVSKKCVPSFDKLSNEQILNYETLVIENQILLDDIEKITKIKLRKYQHFFRKRVLDRDKKCVICCEKHPDVLEAAHIKPYKYCERNSIEIYDEQNGITLCSNHHKLFDKNNFTFNNDWTIKFLKGFEKTDSYLEFKQYEPCYNNLKFNKSSISAIDYLKFRNKNYINS